MSEKKKLPTIEEIASSLVESLNETESVLNTFRNIGNYYFRKKIHKSDVELKELLDKDTERFISMRSEYETMFHYLEKKKLTEDYAKFRGEVHAAIQAKLKPEVKDEVKA